MHLFKKNNKVTGLSFGQVRLTKTLIKITCYEIRFFDIVQTIEKIWNMEWKDFSMEGNGCNGKFLSMEWKISKDIEYGKLLFHCILLHAQVISLG